MRADHPLLASAEERAAYFALAGAKLGYAPEVVEKDFWVCVTLAAMRASEDELRWVFKGGTSLSTAYGVIERFSEDIDLTLSRDGFPLLDEVVEHKETWLADKGARYDLAKTEIRLIPDGALAVPAERDYAAMASMFPESPVRPTWAQIVSSCAEVQQTLRARLAARLGG